MKQSTFSAQVANNLLTVLQGYSKTIRLLLVMFLTLTVSANAWGAEETATLSFASTAQRVSQTTTKQVWSNGGITFTNNKASSTTNVANYSNPVRLYANSEVIVEHTSGKMTKIVFDCNSTNYVNTMKTSIGTVSGATVTVSSDKVTVTFTSAATSFTVAKLSGQIRLDAITVTYTAGGGSTPDPTTHTIKWHTAVGETTDVALEEGATITKPATDPTMTGYVFMGWTEDCEVASDGAGFTPITNFGTATEDKDYYAVFAEATTTGGGGGSTTELFSEDFSSITSGNSTSTSGSGTTWNGTDNFPSVTNAYQAGGAVKIGTSKNAGALVTKQLTAAIGETLTISFKVKGWSSVEGDIQVSGNNSEFAQPAAITYTSTMSGSFETKTVSVVLTKANPYIKIATTAKRAFIDDIVITKTTSGVSTSYDNYITTCAGSTPDPIGYTITYNTNGGDAIAATSGTALPNPLPTPTREHYTFVGWYTDESCTQAATAGATIDADITLYAKWEATMYTVTLNPNYPAGKTGTFKDKGGNTVNGNLEVLLQSGTASQALTNFYSSIELDNYAFDGFYTQAEGGSKRVNTGDITGNITFYAHWKEKYTITWSVNGNTALIEPTTFAAGDNTWEMPTTDYDCSGKEFVGWTTNPIIAAQDEAPDPLYTNASQFPNATATYYAVFAENTGGGGSGGYEKLTAALDDYSGEYLIVYEEGPVAFNGGLTTLDATSNNISVTITEGVIASNATTDAAKFTFAKVDGGYSILSASGRYIGRTADSNGLEESTSIAYTNTITITEGNADVVGSGDAHLRYNKDAGQTRFRYYKSSSYTSQQAIALYKKSGSSATYTAYSTSCIPTYSITYDFEGGTSSHCPNTTSVPQGDSYTICDEAPTKEGNTFLHWSDGVNTYNPSDVIATVTTDITLTAVWQPNTYTVTWNSNGEETEVPYNHGVALVVPEEPESCDGVKEFVGWTTHSGYYHATTAPDDIFTTKTTPVTATATYYAVFATPPGTGGGGGGSETTTTLDFTAQGYANETAINKLTVDGVTATFDKGSNSNAPKYYTSGTAIRAYGGNTITLSANQITAATFTFGSSDGSNVITADCGSWDSPTWTGDATDKVVFTIGGTSGNRRIKSIAVTYTSGGGSGSYSDYTTTCQQVEY